MTQVAIQLPDELTEFVNQSVQSGGFHNADEFFISVVSMYKDQVEEGLSKADQAKLENLRRDIQTGIDQLDRGEGSEMNWDEFLPSVTALHRPWPLGFEARRASAS